MAWAYVQGIAWAGTATNGTTAVLPGNTVSGNAIIVLLTHSYAGCPPSITDSQGNTYTSKGSQPQPSGGQYFWVFTAVAGSSAACTLTLNCACGSARAAFAVEISGLQSNPYNVQNTNANTANDCTTGSITPTTDGELVMSIFSGAATPTFTSAGGATTRLTNSLNNILQTQNQSSAGSVNPSATASAVTSEFPVFGYVASFKATADAAGSWPGYMSNVGGFF